MKTFNLQLLFVISLFFSLVMSACTWVNVCPTSKSGKNVQAKLKIFTPGAVSHDILQRSLGACIMDGSCGISGNTANCEVKKAWKSAWWTGHYEVCYTPGKAKYQCFSSLWRSGDYYKC